MGFEAEVMDALRKGAEDAGGPNALALACGINLPTLTRWLSGDRQPKLKVLGQVMDYLGVTLSTTPPPSSSACPELERECARLRKLLTEKDIRLDELRALLRPTSSEDASKNGMVAG